MVWTLMIGAKLKTKS